MVIHIFMISGSNVIKFWKSLEFQKTGQNRGNRSKIGVKSNFFGIFFIISSIFMVFHNLAKFHAFGIIFGGFTGGGLKGPPPPLVSSKKAALGRVKSPTWKLNMVKNQNLRFYGYFSIGRVYLKYAQNCQIIQKYRKIQENLTFYQEMVYFIILIMETVINYMY